MAANNCWRFLRFQQNSVAYRSPSEKIVLQTIFLPKTNLGSFIPHKIARLRVVLEAISQEQCNWSGYERFRPAPIANTCAKVGCLPHAEVSSFRSYFNLVKPLIQPTGCCIPPSSPKNRWEISFQRRF